MIMKKNSSIDENNVEFYRHKKVTNSNYTPSKDLVRYSSTSTKKNTIYGYVPEKQLSYKSSSNSHHSSSVPHHLTMHQSTG